MMMVPLAAQAPSKGGCKVGGRSNNAYQDERKLRNWAGVTIFVP